MRVEAGGRNQRRDRPGSTVDRQAETGEEDGEHVMGGIGDRGARHVESVDGAENAINVGGYERQRR